jgi:hypothetical protein
VQQIINTVQQIENGGLCLLGSFTEDYNIKLDCCFPKKYMLVSTEPSYAHLPTTIAPYVDVLLSMKHIL